MYYRQAYLTLFVLAIIMLILAHVSRFTESRTIMGVGEQHFFNDTFAMVLAAAALALGQQAGFLGQ